MLNYTPDSSAWRVRSQAFVGRMTTTIVHDTSEAVKLCASQGLYLKPIAKLTVSVALPQLKQPGKSISNWEVMERLKAMVHPEQFSTLRISKSTMEFIRFEGEVENKSVVKTFLAKLDGKTIKLSGFSDILKVRAAEYKMDFPTRHDWDSFFRDAKDMNETVPGERPDTIHLEGLPCKWFASKDSNSEKPHEAILKTVFETFGKIRNIDIPMLDPYREEMMDKNFHTFSFGGHLNFEAYIQYQEYIGFVKAMDALRGMKLMFKGEDGKALACNIKVTFDITKHLSEIAVKKRQLERLKLQELERQREEQKRREKEEEERAREEERRQKQQEEVEKERKREEKLKKREQKQKEREEKRSLKKFKKIQAEEQKKLHQKIALEERKLLLAQRNLESIRLIAELLSRAKTLKQQEKEHQELEKLRLLKLEEKQKQQAAELQRVEEEKARTLELQKREKELRERLLCNLLKKKSEQLCTNFEGDNESCGQLKSDLNVNTILYSSDQTVPDEVVFHEQCEARANGTAIKGEHSSQFNGQLVKDLKPTSVDKAGTSKSSSTSCHSTSCRTLTSDDDVQWHRNKSQKHFSRERSKPRHASKERRWRSRHSSADRHRHRDRRDTASQEKERKRDRSRHSRDSSRERSRNSEYGHCYSKTDRRKQRNERASSRRGVSWD
ncbi:A-kinase anchor protein 17A isoform X1 [Polypterus senegalus]|nr:A-kinase anchor protein 17A isoform X1 [Polypterus senegalus]